MLSLIFGVACSGQTVAASAPRAPAATEASSAVAANSAAAPSAAAPSARTSAAEASGSNAPSSDAPLAQSQADAPPAASEALPLPKGTLVLQVGDSFAAALGVELGKRLKAAGVRSALEYKTASYIPNWSFGPEIPEYLGKYSPDLVLVTLGANEIEIPKPEQRVGAIKHLVAELGGRPCVWVLPPLWKPDTGLIQVIKDNVAPCRYLDSSALVPDLPRGRDKIHPSAEGREIWAEAVFKWLRTERAGDEKHAWALKPSTVPK
ncbi:MAG TPA: SGNH/GDSL hydrolase family protein [Polyangiaceae bacterium]|nr:SGNH/GDSL hydrolase family protein [Polyangiaceae bacterium]